MSRTHPHLLVIVSPHRSAVETVEYALREARDARAEHDEPPAVTILLPPPVPATGRTARRDEIESAVAGFADDDGLDVAVEGLAADESDPAGLTEAVVATGAGRSVSRVIVDPRSDVSVETLRAAFGIPTVEVAPADVNRGRRRLVHPGGTRRFVAVFATTYLFYLAIGGFALGLDLLTGAISASVVALSLSRVTLRVEPTPGRTGARLLRLAAFLPVLLWEIAKANAVIAAVILDPRLPIDPSMGTIDTATEEGIERMVLANSITLTPGTLAVDVRGPTFTIHSLTAGAREDLEGGRLERLIAWVFHGGREEGDHSDLGEDGGSRGRRADRDAGSGGSTR